MSSLALLAVLILVGVLIVYTIRGASSICNGLVSSVSFSSMNRLALLCSCAFLVLSCGQQNGNDVVAPGETAYATLEKYLSEVGAEWGLEESSRFVYHHRDEILSTLEVESTIQIGNTDLYLVLFSFVARNRKKYDSYIMRNFEGEWVFSNSYLSTYSMEKWPGVSTEEMERLEEKKESWESFTPSDVWW